MRKNFLAQHLRLSCDPGARSLRWTIHFSDAQRIHCEHPICVHPPKWCGLYTAESLFEVVSSSAQALAWRTLVPITFTLRVLWTRIQVH